MADIRNWAALLRGRWDWSRFGYEKGFPRGCQFTDTDAALEFDNKRLIIEAKQHDGIDAMDYPADGQMSYLRDEKILGKAVIVLYGCGVCNNPHGVRIIGETRNQDQWKDWRGRPLDERRRLLKQEIDTALGLAGAAHE